MLATEAVYRDTFGDSPDVTPVRVEVLPRQAVLNTELSAHLAERVRTRLDLEKRLSELKQKADAARDRMDELYAQAARDSNAAGRALETALARIEELYRQHGARYGHLYVQDIRQAARIPAHEDAHESHFMPSQVPVGAVMWAREPTVKIKRNGPDVEATKAASEAAKSDPALNAALTTFRDARDRLFITMPQVDDARERFMAATSDVLRTRKQIEAVQQDIAQAWEDMGRIDSGVHPQARRSSPLSLTPDDVVVYPDGTTNLWVETGQGEDKQWERVCGTRTKQVYGTPRQVLVTASGTEVFGTERYANFTVTRTSCVVWVDPPGPHARPATQVIPNLTFAEVLDTSG